MLTKEQIKLAIEMYNEVVDIVSKYDELDDLVGASELQTFNYEYDLVDFYHGPIGGTIYVSMQVDTRIDYGWRGASISIDLKKYSKRLDNSQKLCYNENIKEGI